MDLPEWAKIALTVCFGIPLLCFLVYLIGYFLSRGITDSVKQSKKQADIDRLKMAIDMQKANFGKGPMTAPPILDPDQPPFVKPHDPHNPYGGLPPGMQYPKPPKKGQ